MYNAGKRFLYWVVYVPLGINVFLYAVELISRTMDWFYSEPGSISSSVQHIFLGRNYTFEEFLQLRLRTVILAMFLGFGLWLYEYYSAKKEFKDEVSRKSQSSL